MNKKLLKPLILAVVFIVAVIFFNIITNKSNEDMTTTMAPATLPVMSFEYKGFEVNECFGYVKEMKLTEMREDITPIEEDRLLHLRMDTFEKEINAITYEIRSLDGSKLMSTNEVNFTQEDGKLSADVKVENILTLQEEYVIVFTVMSGEDKFYYYTRIMETVDEETDICLNFAKDFHDHTLDKSQDGSYFANYVDAATGDTTSFHYVDLTCTARQIMYKGFDCAQVSELQISINEITENYNAITFNYVLSSVTGDGEIEYYNVEEYFRLRQGSTQMFVLNYERTTNQIFQPENSFINGKNAIQLGIVDPNIEYDYDETGKIIAFVSQGALWSYDIANNSLGHVFSFRSLESKDHRENLLQHGIRILRVNEAGSIDFIVYGYMNRGRHEGEVGVGVYHYDGIAHTVTEEAFLPTTSSYSVLEAELGKLLFQSDRGIVFFTMNSKLYSIDLNAMKIAVEVDNLSEGCYTSSKSSRFFAWVEQKNQYQSNKLWFMDLVDGTIKEITVSEGEYIRPLGFINEDFIYGVANASDVLVDAAGTITFPMKTLRIVSSVNPDEEVIKEYNTNGDYIGNISVDSFIIYISKIQFDGSKYVAAGSDQIMNREADTDTVVYTTDIATEGKETQRFINFKDTALSGKVKHFTPKEVIAEQDTKVELTEEEEDAQYFVYVKGRAIFTSDSISTAILLANEKNAVVVDQKQHYVWQRSRKVYKDPMTNISPMDADAGADSIVKSISAMLNRAGAAVGVSDMIAQGYTPKQVLEMSLKDYRVLDLTGCTVDEMLYYVNQGTPVFGMTDSSNAVLITGYTSNVLFYYDTNAGHNIQVPMDQAKQMFYNGGNIFFSYIEE